MKQTYRYLTIFILALAAFFLWQADAGTRASHPQLTVRFFDVGQGDATFVETPGGQQVLIDGGPQKNVMRELNRALPFWDRTIDVVLLTHPQLDHLSGLVPVLEHYRVKRLILNGAAYRLDAYAALLNTVRRKNIPLVLAHAGEKIIFDNGITAEILNPNENVAGKEFKEVNETSVVLRLDYKNTSFLFTGDAGFPTEEQLLARGAPIDVDVLKVGHHGSRYASSETFLKAVTPRIAVIEVGAKNTYGHPTPETLSRLAAVGATVFRTDQDGTVILASDGTTVSRLLPKSCFLWCAD